MIRFLPWVGEAYERGGWGARVLIVGESHHGPAYQNANERFTIEGIEQVIAGGGWARLAFFRNLQRTFPGEESLHVSARRRFWHRVAFYNYVQEMLPGPGVAPTADAWVAARAPFAAVLARLEPTCIVFADKRLFHAARCHAEPHQPARDLRVGARSRKVLHVPLPSGMAVASYILHPTYRGYRKQRAWVTALLERARGREEPE